MKLLLTGSSGFIGKHFIEKYKNKYCFYYFSFLKNKLEDTIFDGIDAVIHLAAMVHQLNGATYDKYYVVNVLNTMNLAKAAKKTGVKHFIFMSTIKVYGEESDVPYTEDSVCNPLDESSKSKFEAENELKKLEDDSFKVSIIRSPIVYGKGVKANVYNLVQLVNKISVLPLGQINNRRSMVFVGNLCDMIDHVLSKNMRGIFLAGDDHTVSTSELLRLIAHAKGRKLILLKLPFFEFLLRKLKPDLYKRLYKNLIINNQKTKNMLGFRNNFSIEHGIKEMVK